MALACAVAHLARRGCQHATASAAVIDHGLQPASSEVAAEVANRLNEIGLAVTTRRVNVAADSPDGMEAAARDARYVMCSRSESEGILSRGEVLVKSQEKERLLSFTHAKSAEAQRHGNLICFFQKFYC